MTSFLLLARELFDRATNPAHGVESNEDHAARLAAALGPEDIQRFASEVGRLDDPAGLTSYGWAWVLEFALGHQVTLDRALLADLCLRWDEPSLKALAIEAAIDRDESADSRSDDRDWLDEVIGRAAPMLSRPGDASQGADDRARPTEAVDISSAESLLTALLIVGTDLAMDTARRLLRRSWPGAEQLADFVAACASDPFGGARWAALQG